MKQRVKVMSEKEKISTNRLFEFRKKNNMTQLAVANAIGTTRGHYIRLEKGETKLNERWLNDLARLYKCTPQEMLAQVETPMVTQRVDETLMADVSIAVERVAAKRDLKLKRAEFLDYCVGLYNYVQKIRGEKDSVEVNTALAELFMDTKRHAAN
jgi:transcriptional regulator with XRE-family HTH domain